MGKEENIRHKGALGEWGLGVEGYVALGIIALILARMTPKLLKIMYFGKCCKTALGAFKTWWL